MRIYAYWLWLAANLRKLSGASLNRHKHPPMVLDSNNKSQYTYETSVTEALRHTLRSQLVSLNDGLHLAVSFSSLRPLPAQGYEADRERGYKEKDNACGRGGTPRDATYCGGRMLTGHAFTICHKYESRLTVAVPVADDKSLGLVTRHAVQAVLCWVTRNRATTRFADALERLPVLVRYLGEAVHTSAHHIVARFVIPLAGFVAHCVL